MKIISILLALSFLGTLVSCKNKKTQEVLTTQKVEIAETVKTEPEPAPQETPPPVMKQANYYLVAGCFRITENADRLHAKLVNEGYNSQIVPFYDMSMVTYEGYQTHREAQTALNRIVGEPGKEDTWIYPVK